MAESEKPTNTQYTAWNIPTVKPDLSGGYDALPYTFLNPEYTLHNPTTLGSMALATGKSRGDIPSLQTYSPERTLLQEAIFSAITEVQLKDGEALNATVKSLIEAIPAEQLSDFKTRMNDLYRDSHERLQEAVKTGDTQKLTEDQKSAFDQVRTQIQEATRKNGNQPNMIDPNETVETITAKRAASIVYENAARSESQKLVQVSIDAQEQQGSITRLTKHERQEARIAMVNGGQASGKGTNVGMITNEIASQSNLSPNDRAYVNGDAYKPLLEGPEHRTDDNKFIKSQLVQNETAMIKGRVMQHLRTAERIPNIVIDQVYPAPGEIALGTQGNEPMKLVVIGRDVDVAIEGSYARGFTKGRFENTDNLLNTHRNISKDLPDIIASNMGKNIQLEIYDNNGKHGEPTLIMSGDLKTGTVEVLDVLAAERLFKKSHINTKAQSAAETRRRGGSNAAVAKYGSCDAGIAKASCASDIRRS